MGLFSKKKDAPATTEPPLTVQAGGQPVRKDRPTPTRREAEAARMARLHPALDPKKAKQIEREARAVQRRKEMDTIDASPERQLVRDVVDSRFNVGEVALPAMLLVVAVFLLPVLTPYANWNLYVVYVVILALALDHMLMWRRVKKLAAERLPGRSLRGLGFYALNRQMSFRRWRQPVPRVKRGDTI